MTTTSEPARYPTTPEEWQNAAGAATAANALLKPASAVIHCPVAGGPGTNASRCRRLPCGAA